MENDRAANSTILPREKWWWLGLGLLMLLAGWLYLRGYDVSLPYIAHPDEAHHLLAGQHTIDFGHARGVWHEAYPPGTKTLAYLFLKHLKPVEANHGTMLPALRLLTISVWTLIVAVVALLGRLVFHPLTGLIAALVWLVNPWVVERAHWLLPDGYLTLFTLLALYLALLGWQHRRRSFSTAAVYFLMLAIVFKTQAMFLAPIILLLPMLHWRANSPWRDEALRQTFWNCVRFAVFLFWLLLIYPTLEVDSIIYFPTSYSDMSLPSLEYAVASLRNVWRPFRWSENWLAVAIALALLWRYRRRTNALAFAAVVLSAAAYMLGMSMFNVQRARHYFVVGAIISLLYGAGFTAVLFALQDLTSRLTRSFLSARVRSLLPPAALALLLASHLLPSYQKSDALARDYSLHDRRNDLAHYADTSLPPGMYISDYANHGVFIRSWGGYDGAHDFKYSGLDNVRLADKPIDEWRELGAEYAIMPWTDEPDAYYPAETVTLKSYPPDPNFRGPSMVVLRLHPMQRIASGQLGGIHLVGYDINGSAFQPGDEIVFRHYWQAEEPTATPQHVFNHLLDAQGSIAAQSDYVPLWDARRNTTTWDDPEEILLGREFTLSLPLDLPPGDYRLISGFYDPETWQRLLAPDGGDHVIISAIRILSQ